MGAEDSRKYNIHHVTISPIPKHLFDVGSSTCSFTTQLLFAVSPEVGVVEESASFKLTLVVFLTIFMSAAETCKKVLKCLGIEWDLMKVWKDLLAPIAHDIASGCLDYVMYMLCGIMAGVRCFFHEIVCCRCCARLFLTPARRAQSEPLLSDLQMGRL